MLNFDIITVRVPDLNRLNGCCSLSILDLVSAQGFGIF